MTLPMLDSEIRDLGTFDDTNSWPVVAAGISSFADSVIAQDDTQKPLDQAPKTSSWN